MGPTPKGQVRWPTKNTNFALPVLPEAAQRGGSATRYVPVLQGVSPLCQVEAHSDHSALANIPTQLAQPAPGPVCVPTKRTHRIALLSTSDVALHSRRRR